MHKNNIFNIPSNHNFLYLFFDFLKGNFSDIANVKIFLPNNRSCRELKKVFLQSNQTQILPKIKAISEISYEDFFEIKSLDPLYWKALVDELLENKVLSKIDYLLFLTKEIQKQTVFGADLEFGQAFKISTNLEKIFEELEAEEITLEKINEIDDSSLSLFKQVNLEFLKNFYSQIKNSLLKKNIISSNSNQNLIIKNYIKLLEKSAINFPIIIAGSTGSMPFSRKLIKAIANQKNGYVVLYGLNNPNDLIEENHPQFFLNQLISFLEIDQNSIKNLKKDEFLLSSQNRLDMLSLLMLTSNQTTKWQNINQFLEVKNLEEDLEKNFQLIEAKNLIEEAKIISLMISISFSNSKIKYS